jgi:hypothetical protein
MELIDKNQINELIYNHFRSLEPFFKVAFAYGSSVYPQSRQKSKSMLDLILAVDNIEEFHNKNYEINPSDYSSISKFLIKNRLGIPHGVLFNTDIRRDKWRFKYGIVSLNELEADLWTWDQMYLAGRLQKPVLFLNSRTDSLKNFYAALNYNRQSAFKLSCLIERLDSKLDKKNIYTRLISLSYNGDPRTKLAEAPDKIENILNNQLNLFDEIYGEMFENRHLKLEQHLSGLPFSYLKKLYELCGWREIKPGISHLACKIESNKKILVKGMEDLVYKSALKQSFRGLWTAKPSTILSYSVAKLKKKFRFS